MQVHKLAEIFSQTTAFENLEKSGGAGVAVELRSAAGSGYALALATMAQYHGGLHIAVMEDKDAAAYLCNDLYGLLGSERVMFFPTAYKRSVQFGQEDPSGIVQRTAALGAISGLAARTGKGIEKRAGKGDPKGATAEKHCLVICTWPEALSEKVVDTQRLAENTLTVRRGDSLSMSFVEELLREGGFEKVDFVFEPGHYAVRGGIIDLFSYSANRPVRLDFFGDQVESVRSFGVATQLSDEQLESIDVVPNLKRIERAVSRVSLARFAAGATWWIDSADHALVRLDAIRSGILKELDDPSQISRIVTSRKEFLEDTALETIYFRGKFPGRQAGAVIDMGFSPQPSFNKKFDLLADDIIANRNRGFTTYILSENHAQTERLENIFHSIERPDAVFESIKLTLHEGFVSAQMKACVYTDHQLFERYHRYRIEGGVEQSDALTVADLGTLQVGDYVTHIDHGVGRFGGLVRTMENGRVHEAVKLEYRDGDVLLVNVHALHRIARYKSREGDAPKIHKLGSGAWQRIKEATKKSVKDIARELIALYATRKSSGGFRFSHDTYMQQELEASFAYEETPDQQAAIAAIKTDMESPQPMDRLICGDVGFGKTEVAIRAAFKAVADSRQVAVLVPTTILSLQHYRTFSHRLRDFPVRVEHLSRAKTPKEVRQILEDLKAGKIDILIGTHKILGKEVQFKSLGLLIIDEEQKFGVSSKERLRQMSVNVDTLTMTATPIPRTLQFSLMGSRDLSVIATPPPNRQPIATESHLFDEQIIKEAIEAELSRHGQVYFVHNRVEDIHKFESLIKKLCPQASVAVGHGQMEPQKLEKIVMDFIYGEYDVLLSTTIIENGIDIPNANTIIIDQAQNFGLSDLHQLRGRVGRSDRKAYCYLLTSPDEVMTSDARRRLRALEEFSDLGSGFNIAMQDLDIRGAGNLLGAQQSGFIADIGFETYQKILAEAMDELRAEGLDTAAARHDEEAEELSAHVNYISDCYIEVDTEAMLPDDYIGQSIEKIRLYRRLDTITTEDELQRFEAELADRFGPLPPAASELLDVIRLRRICIWLGIERVKIKNGVMILTPLQGSQAYFQSPTFLALLKYSSEHPNKFMLRQNNNKLSFTVKEIKGTRAGVEVLKRIIA